MTLEDTQGPLEKLSPCDSVLMSPVPPKILAQKSLLSRARVPPTATQHHCRAPVSAAPILSPILSRGTGTSQKCFRLCTRAMCSELISFQRLSLSVMVGPNTTGVAPESPSNVISDSRPPLRLRAEGSQTSANKDEAQVTQFSTSRRLRGLKAQQADPTSHRQAARQEPGKSHNSLPKVSMRGQ